jgi:hypothetical protein
MAERFLGDAGSKRRWRLRFLLLPVLLGGALALFMAGGALAVHDTGAFELDGNATNGAAVGDDWDNVCHQVTGSDCSTTSDTNGATAVSFTTEATNNSSIFTGGGSKDPIDVSSWAWKDAGGLPDKDNLQHGFAARYSLTPDATHCPAGTAATCDVLFFGSDRLDNSGDAQQGFWFFQNKITLGSTPNGGGSNFNGVHKDGDVLIISDFSNGGTTSFISVYEWDHTVNGNLRLLSQSGNARCDLQGSGDGFCGVVNATNGTIAPWPFTDKSGLHTYLNGEFYEGGVNLSTLGLAGECFSSVASETRSSTSTTATLKDFVLGQFATCKPNMTTQASATTANPVAPGTAVHDTATITVTGGTSAPDPTGDVEFFLCGPIASGDCSAGGTDVGHGTLGGGVNLSDGLASAQSPDVNTGAGSLAPGRYCFRAEWPGDLNYGATSFTNDSDECFGVKDTSTTTTAQNWLPNDTATVATAGGTAVSGTVDFTLYDSANCTGTVLGTFSDSSAPFTTSNTTVYTANKTISWRSVFTPSDTNAVVGSRSHCETSTVTINNDIGS